MHALESLGVCPEYCGDLIIPIVMKKLSEEVRRIMLRSHDQTPWTLVDFRKQLQHEVETREKSSLGQSDKEVSGLHFQFQGLYSWCLVHWCAGKRERQEWLYVL